MWSDRLDSRNGRAPLRPLPVSGEMAELSHELRVWCQSGKTSRLIDITPAIWPTLRWRAVSLHAYAMGRQNLRRSEMPSMRPPVRAAVSAKARQSPLRGMHAAEGDPRGRPQMPEGPSNVTQ